MNKKETKPHPLSPTETGVGTYCVPANCGNDGDMYYIIKFEDNDRGVVIITDRQMALEKFAMLEHLGWNCSLFEPMRRDGT